MSILDRYIGKTVLLACLMVILTISGLDSLFAFIAELEDLNDRYTLLTAGHYILLTVPRRVVEHVPMSVMVGCLVGLGVLANSSELNVMRAAGISKARILLAVMKPVILLLLVVGLIGEFVAPTTEQAAVAKRAAIFGGGQAIGSKHGIWHREGKWFMHINAIEPGGDLIGVTLYAFDDQRQLQTAGFARRAEHRDGQWRLQQLRLSHFEADRIRLEAEPERLWLVTLDPELLAVLSVKPDKMSMRGLYRYSRYIEAQEINSSPYVMAFWKKFFMPLGVFALVLVAMSSVFGPLRSVSMGQRVMAGIMIGVVFKIVQDLLGPASTVYGFSPLVASLLPIAICFAAGGWMLRRAR